MSMDAAALSARVALIRGGDRRAIATLIRDLDDERPHALDVLRALMTPAIGDGPLRARGQAQESAAPYSAPHLAPVGGEVADRRSAGEGPPQSPAAAAIIGITGGPGAGKSTLVDALVAHWRAAGERVGVVAVDPSSAHAGGAVLGDRIRMQRHATDPDVFIRSLASRGALGGLSRSAMNAAAVLRAGGFARVLVETVGAGQAEVDIAAAADVTVVVLTPGLGDDIQMLKAGILEIADVLVLNKADRPGADAALRELQAMLNLRSATAGAPAVAPNVPAGEHVSRPPVNVPIVQTVATTGAGVDALAQAIKAVPVAAGPAGVARRRQRAAVRILAIVTARTDTAARAALGPAGAAATLADDVAAFRLDPDAAADALMARLRGGY